MLSVQTIAVVKSTIPLLDGADVAITNHFYARMFRINPELQDIFNMSNQRNGRQQFALFSAIAAYAKNIDNLGVLTETVERIAHKHTSLHVQSQHYQIVGHHLIETLRELAPDAFTKEVEAAWTEAYLFLANISIAREQQLYELKGNAKGGWFGARRFKILHKNVESLLVTSFVLKPLDGEAVVDYKAGQYLGVRVKPLGAPYFEVRQYSLSDKPNGETYRISVKREANQDPGVVSNFLHDSVHEGDELDIYPPAGDFFLQAAEGPTVLISAGVGLTPMMAMLEEIAATQTHAPVCFLHACENEQQHSFVKRIEILREKSSAIKNFTWYNNHQLPLAGNAFGGFMDISTVAPHLQLTSSNFYLCGPTGFMRYVRNQLLALGVESERIHYEVFGPHSDL